MLVVLRSFVVCNIWPALSSMRFTIDGSCSHRSRYRRFVTCACLTWWGGDPGVIAVHNGVGFSLLFKA